MAPQQTDKFQTTSFRHFHSTLRKEASPIMDRFGRSFRLLLEGTLQRIKLFILPSVGGATRFTNLWRKFNKTKKSAAELYQILRMVTIEIVINSTRVMGIRVTISCRYCIGVTLVCGIS